MHKKWDMPPESSDLRYFPDSILILDVQKTCHISTNFQFWPKIFYTPTFYDVGSNISKEIRILETSLSKSPDFAWFLQTMSLQSNDSCTHWCGALLQGCTSYFQQLQSQLEKILCNDPDSVSGCSFLCSSTSTQYNWSIHIQSIAWCLFCSLASRKWGIPEHILYSCHRSCFPCAHNMLHSSVQSIKDA